MDLRRNCSALPRPPRAILMRAKNTSRVTDKRKYIRLKSILPVEFRIVPSLREGTSRREGDLSVGSAGSSWQQGYTCNVSEGVCVLKRCISMRRPSSRSATRMLRSRCRCASPCIVRRSRPGRRSPGSAISTGKTPPLHAGVTVYRDRLRRLRPDA